VAAVLLLFPATAVAHAELVETTPADGATVVGTPEELVAVFDEPLEADESSLSIRNDAGERLAFGRVDPDDPTRLVIGDIPELGRGTYEMRWTAGTADGHVERGTWSFSVVPAPPTKTLPTPTASASPAASLSPISSSTPGPTAAPTPSASSAPSDPTGGSGSDVILPIIVALALVLIAAGFLLSRRGRPSYGA